MISLSGLSVSWYLITTKTDSQLLSLIFNKAGNGLLIPVLEKLNQSSYSRPTEVKTGSVTEENHVFQLGFSLPFYCYIAQNTLEKIGALIRFMRFLSSMIAFYLSKSTIQPWPCIEKY